MVNWIVSDITSFQPSTTYDSWHDRATFHFLTSGSEVSRYMEIARENVSGYMAIGTFSENGPEKCSGLPVKQYNELSLTREFQNGFNKIKCFTEDYITPFKTSQNFVFCSFKKQAIYTIN